MIPGLLREGLAEIRAYLAARLTRPRRVTMPHLLVAVDSAEAGVHEIPVGDAAVARHLAEHPWQRGRLACREDVGAAAEDRGVYVRIEFDRITGAPSRAQAFRDPEVADIERDRAGVRHRSFRPVIALPFPPAAR